MVDLNIPINLPQLPTGATPSVTKGFPPSLLVFKPAKLAGAEKLGKIVRDLEAKFKMLAGLTNKPIAFNLKIKGITVYSVTITPLSVAKKLI